MTRFGSICVAARPIVRGDKNLILWAQRLVHESSHSLPEPLGTMAGTRNGFHPLMTRRQMPAYQA